MENKILISNVQVDKNKISYSYIVEGEWKQYFNMDEDFYIEYSEDVSMVPKSVAVVPLLCNVLPMAWVCDAEIIVDEVDKDFYDSIVHFKRGYINMYPKVEFKGKLTAEKIIESHNVPSDKTAAFFSGGVDAFSTLITHLNEKPVLITLWGSDIFFYDTDGWNRVKNQTLSAAKDFQLEHLFIKSSFRRFLNEGKLGKLVCNAANDLWWHGFQHGIGLIGHAAPYAFKNKLKTVYIASSFTEKDKGKVTCASDPTIDNQVKFCRCSVLHDGYEFTRQDKVHRICYFVNTTGNKIILHVCWQSSGGQNCCRCEKCIRTIFALLAEQVDPAEYGFLFSKNDLDKMIYTIRHKIIMSNIIIPLWKDIQQAFISKQEQFKDNSQLSWILTYNFDHVNRDPQKIARHGYHRVKRIFNKK